MKTKLRSLGCYLCFCITNIEKTVSKSKYHLQKERIPLLTFSNEDSSRFLNIIRLNSTVCLLHYAAKSNDAGQYLVSKRERTSIFKKMFKWHFRLVLEFMMPLAQ